MHASDILSIERVVENENDRIVGDRNANANASNWIN